VDVARAELAAGELPIGAVVVVDSEVVASAHTQDRAQRRRLVHAELLALDVADRALTGRRRRAALYSTLEPCLACLGAAMVTWLGRVVYGLQAPGDGAAELVQHWAQFRDETLVPEFRPPDLVSGLRRGEVLDLLDVYVQAHSEPDGLTRYAAALAALR
jgi:tRNA(adenine34) deaminase